MSGNAPLWTLKIPLILINCIAVQVIWIFCLYINFSKTFYSSEGPVYAILWIFFLFVIFCGYNWIFNNLCAAGSRAFLGQGIIITGVGLLSVSIAIINKGKLVFPVALLVIGLFNLVPSFLKSAKEFRTSACLSKQNVPIQMIYSILLLIALITFYVVGDIIKNLEDNTKLSLFAITFFIPCISIAVLPLYFGWRWRDGFALRFYQLLLALIAAYYLIAPLSGVAEPVGIVESILALGIICIAFSLTFHAAVRKWAANLKPVF